MFIGKLKGRSRMISLLYTLYIFMTYMYVYIHIPSFPEVFVGPLLEHRPAAHAQHERGGAGD